LLEVIRHPFEFLARNSIEDTADNLEPADIAHLVGRRCRRTAAAGQRQRLARV
jgi:hypothetical protein